MRIRLIWVGKTKERFLVDGIEEYAGRVRGFATLEVIEIKEEKTPDRQRALQREGERILSATSDYMLLDERGRAFDSEGLAGVIGARASMDFVLGGPYGVSGEVRQKASATIALSGMTFTHEMARLIFMEQLYRAMTINKGMRYHH